VRVTDVCTARGLAHARIGVVDDEPTDGDQVLAVQGLFTLPLGELGRAWRAPLRERFGG
jgi:phosphoribosylformylglycinamidine synthase